MTNSSKTRSHPFRRLDVRLAIGVLAAALPVMAGMAGLLVAQSSTSLTTAAESKAALVARAIDQRLNDWLSERHDDLQLVVDDAGADDGIDLAANAREVMGQLDSSSAEGRGDYAVIEVTDLLGNVLAASHPLLAVDPSGEASASAVQSGSPPWPN